MSTHDTPYDKHSWDMMPPGWTSETVILCGEVEFDDVRWQLGREENGIYIYLITDLPHLDNSSVNTVFRLNPLRQVSAFCAAMNDQLEALSNEQTHH